MAGDFARAFHRGELEGDQVLALFARVNILAHRMVFVTNTRPILNSIIDSEERFSYLIHEQIPSYTQLRSMFHYRSHAGHRMLTLGIMVSEPAAYDQRPIVDLVFSFMDIARMWQLQKRA